MARHRIIERSVGTALYKSFWRAESIVNSTRVPTRSTRAKLISLRSWMGPFYWQIFLDVIATGSLSRNASRTASPSEIRLSRDALAMIHDWEQECKRWGLVD